MANTQTKAPTIEFVGKSGHKYTFYIYALDTPFKAVGGVYIFTKAELNTAGGHTHTVLYVGQTGDLSSRFVDHHKQDCVDRRGCNRICVMVVTGTEEQRRAIELDLIAAYNPPCNG